ncbi:MAG: GTPase domain-containing protein [Candidatus Heimdallarchaeota archaeon]
MSSKSGKYPVQKSSESILCLSYFDSIIGPSTFFCNSPLNTKDHPDLGRILEFQETEGNFMFTYRKYQTINHIFYIDSKYARGGKDILMITYMIRAAYYKDEISDVYRYLESKFSVLDEFAAELREFEELTEILHKRKSSKEKLDILNLASERFKKKFLDTYNKYYQKISPQIPLGTSIATKKNLKKIFIFGPPKSGKTTLLKNLEVIQFLQYKDDEKKRDLVNKIYDFIIDNIELMNYECINGKPSEKDIKLYQTCIDNSQGFILLFNASDKNSIKDTIDIFQLVLNRCLKQGETMPILIIGNKFHGKEEISPDFIYKNFDLEELSECGMPVKYFPINVLSEDEKIIEALRWLLKQLI